MPRRVQDIVPGEHRHVRDVPAERQVERAKPERPKIVRETKDAEPEQEIKIHHKPLGPLGPVSKKHLLVTPPPPRAKRQGNRLKWLILALSIIAIIGIIGFVASSYYSRATFTITPKVIDVPVNGTFVAQIASATSTLAYEVVTVKGAASSTVAATDGPSISTKSTGKITLYNSYSNQPVRLIAGTRLSSDGNSIYRLPGSVIIPGYTNPSGTIMPGKTVVSIVADQPGQAYNLTKSDNVDNFKVVAYKGGPRYESVYAKMATDISGGFVGVKKITDASAVASTTAKIKAYLTTSLLAQAKSAVPQGYIMYDNSYISSFATPDVGGVIERSATITLQGTVYGIIFKKNELLAKISNGQSGMSFGSFSYTSPGLEELQVAIVNLKDFSPSKKVSLVMKVKGDVKLIGTVPVDDIVKKLEGISLAKTPDVFKSYSSVIASGTGELVPPWAKIPKNPKRIAVTVQMP